MKVRTMLLPQRRSHRASSRTRIATRSTDWWFPRRAKRSRRASGEYGDMVKMGVLEPCKVTRSGLRNAASIADLILTTDCMIAQVPARPAAGATEMEAA